MVNSLNIKKGDRVKCIGNGSSKFYSYAGAGWEKNLEFTVTSVAEHNGYNLYFGAGKYLNGVASDCVKLVGNGIKGYRLKTKYIKFADTVLQIEGNRWIGQNIKRGGILEINAVESIKKLKDAGILDLWFEEVYDVIVTLPSINGYKGVMETDKNYVQYGCATLAINSLRKVIEVEKISVNRQIKSIKLNSGVEISMEDIKQIVEYVDSDSDSKSYSFNLKK